MRDESIASAINNAHERTRSPIGIAVEKVSGYPFPGEVRAVFTTRSGKVRFVVEATGAAYAGMLHIFNADQLERRPSTDTSEDRGDDTAS